MDSLAERAATSDWPDQWREDLPADPGSDKEEATAILSHWEPPIPAIYCHRPVETADYPVPADLRNSQNL